MQGEQGEKHDFANGDAVIATDGGLIVVGVVTEIYDDVVEVDYFDGEFGIMDTMEFHVSDVERVI